MPTERAEDYGSGTKRDLDREIKRITNRSRKASTTGEVMLLLCKEKPN